MMNERSNFLLPTLITIILSLVSLGTLILTSYFHYTKLMSSYKGKIIISIKKKKNLEILGIGL